MCKHIKKNKFKNREGQNANERSALSYRLKLNPELTLIYDREHSLAFKDGTENDATGGLGSE